MIQLFSKGGFSYVKVDFSNKEEVEDLAYARLAGFDEIPGSEDPEWREVLPPKSLKKIEGEANFIKSRFGNPDHLAIIVYDESTGEPAASRVINKDSVPGYLYLSGGVAVVPKFRGKHIYHSLTEFLKKYVIDNGYEGLILDVQALRPEAKEIHTKAGFKEVPIDKLGDFKRKTQKGTFEKIVSDPKKRSLMVWKPDWSMMEPYPH